MATVTKPIALDESFNTTEVTPRNIADVLAEGLSHITGRTASEVEYDNTDSGLTSDDVQGAIDELSERPILPSVDIQTAVDEFETYNGGLLSECKVSLTPNQDLHGYDNPWVGGAGKNKWNPEDVYMGFIDGSNEVLTYSVQTRTIFIKCTPSTTYTVSKRAGERFAIAYTKETPTTNVSVYGRISQSTSETLTITVGDDAEYLVAFVWFENADTVTAEQMLATCMIELGSTATDYEPYENICPISGHTEVKVQVKDSADVVQNEVTQSLGTTVYGGTDEMISGELISNMASVDLGTLNWTYGNDRFYTYGIAPNIKREASGRSANGLISSAYKADIGGADGAMFKGNDGALYIYDSRYTDGTSFQTAVTGQTLCYELATPQTIQLSPTMVKALVGENHLSAPLDGQEITESKYKQMFTFDDVNTQIESTYSEGISHNSVYRGKYLGDHVTDEQWDAIGDGSFRDLYIGDYWTINGINWRIAHFNYWLGTGDVKCNTNHVVIVPYGWVSTFNMNATDDTTGGYLNSEWYTTNRHFAVENIEADFGASHILSHRNFFSDAVSDGHASHGMWVDSTVDLMNEIMVCGSLVGSYSGKYYEVGCDKFQLALFKYNPPSTRMDVSYWLRGVSTASSFVAMGNFGLLDGFTASQILKIRPVFAIKK